MWCNAEHNLSQRKYHYDKKLIDYDPCAFHSKEYKSNIPGKMMSVALCKTTSVKIR